MTDPKDHLISWLRDAHAAEEQAVTMLSSLAERVENYPELRARIEHHVKETQRHSELVQGCLQRYGSDASAIKDMGTKMMGFGQGLSGMFTSDEVVKAVLAAYAFEHMEIASYRILIATARKFGDAETEGVFQTILDEEIAMATWLEKNMEEITMKFLDLDAGGHTAKH